MAWATTCSGPISGLRQLEASRATPGRSAHRPPRGARPAPGAPPRERTGRGRGRSPRAAPGGRASGRDRRPRWRPRAGRERARAGRCPARPGSVPRRPPRRPARRAEPTPGSTTARWTPGGQEGSAFGERHRPLAHVLPGDPVGEVDQRRLRRDLGDHRAADAGELVLVAVVGEEGDRPGRRHGRILWRDLESRRISADGVREQRLDQPADVVAGGLDGDLEACLAGGLGGDRADRDDPRALRDAVADGVDEVADRR